MNYQGGNDLDLDQIHAQKVQGYIEAESGKRNPEEAKDIAAAPGVAGHREEMIEKWNNFSDTETDFSS